MRVLTAHQPVYLPWLGLLHKIAISDVYVSLDTAKYLKQDWNNRNKIKTPQGEHYLTVPVVKNSDKARLRDVHIANSRAWRRSHWLSIQNFYRKAPYFEVHFEFFEDVYDKEWEHLARKCANLSWKLKRLQTLWFDGIGRNNIKPVRERSRDEESVTFGEKTQEEASTG